MDGSKGGTANRGTVRRRRSVARGVPGGYRIWDNRGCQWWSDLYELCVAAPPTDSLVLPVCGSAAGAPAPGVISPVS
ncbi:hypothetical protein [Streptomyces chiangmaiensis]|uniref:Uncharacterized protein n=1 Tax=Streptomyces chiangmaiensis TaxID=766497 RepID=A0ABU7FTA6_9ACTN|nr:hypothetical protein [Streptomyces chiangmaiensis]MED7827355.1 hypothetical protein [Streptomyces chiangmaiensis]